MSVAMHLVAVTAVHEQVHERAGQEDQVGQRAEEMRGVLGDQEESCDQKEADQGDRPALA